MGNGRIIRQLYFLCGRLKYAIRCTDAWAHLTREVARTISVYIAMEAERVEMRVNRTRGGTEVGHISQLFRAGALS